jgi:hypothetical protein
MMGWNLYLVADLGAGEQTVCDNNRGYTHNTNKMIRIATDGSSPYEWDGMLASEMAELSARAAAQIEMHQDRYDRLNPPNGWGNRDGLVKELRGIAEDCRAYPNAIVRMSC